MKMTVADALLQHLHAEGVEYIFGVPGLSLVPFFAAMNRNPAVKPVLTKHEEGAAFMADGYARVKGALGACFATAGPGATNLLTGVAGAYMDNVPIVAVTGQVETSLYGKGAIQDSSKEGIDSVKMFESITRHSSMLISKQKALEDLREALRKALSGRRGPVHLSFPKDIQAAEVELSSVFQSAYKFGQEYFDRRLVIEAAEAMGQAKHPVILVGSGAVESGACGDIGELAELMSIPVATTPRAKGAFPEDHPLALGVLGLFGSPLAERYLRSKDVDVLLVVGASMNQVTTLSWDPRLAQSRCLIHVNIDPAEIGKNYRPDIALVGDARTVVNEIYFRVLKHLTKEEEKWIARRAAVAVAKAETGLCAEPEKMVSDAVPVKPQRLMQELQQAMPADAILFADVGNALGWSTHFLRFTRPDAFITPWGLLAMGYGMSAAIGGKLAAPGRPVIFLVGDGCFMMNGMEVATAVNYGVPVVWIVLNNGKLGLVHDMQRYSLGDKTVATRFQRVDCAMVARGLGAEGFRIERPGELQELLPRAFAMGKPVVIDCLIDPEEVPPLTPFLEGTKSYMKTLEVA